MKKITDVSPYFEHKDGQWIFTGKHLELYIPTVYADRDLLSVGSTALSLGILQMRINGMFTTNLLLLTKIEIEFESDRQVEEDGYQYTVLEVLPGQALIKNSVIVKNPNLIYSIFMVFIALGRIPPFLDYNTVQSIFDNDNLLCGVSLGVNHAIWEMIYAHMYRDKQDPYKVFRYTPMTNEPQIVALHNISHGPRSTSSKLIGAYMADGLVSALVDTNPKEPSIVENLLR